MTKKADTDPNFPPASEPSEDSIDEMLAGLGKPFALKPTEKKSDSGGAHAVEYQAEPRTPPARAEHNTFPNAPVIVSQSNPGLPPPANAPFEVSAEERARLDAMLLEKSKEKAQRDADTSPRKVDPPGVATDPTRKPSSSSRVVLVAGIVLAAIIIGAVAIRTSANQHTTDAAPSTTTTVSGTATTSAVSTPTTTSTATETATTAEVVAPTVNTAAPVHTTAPVETSTHTAPTATHIHVTPTATAPATTEPTATATVTAPPGFKPGN